MRYSKTEIAPMIMFSNTMAAELPLGTPMKLANFNFDMPMSFFYGEYDWACRIEEDIADVILSNNRYNIEFEDVVNAGRDEDGAPPGLKQSIIHLVPTSDHFLHMDNPMALANLIINDIYDLELPLDVNQVFLDNMSERKSINPDARLSQ